MSDRFTRPGVWLALAGLCAVVMLLPDGFHQAVITNLQPSKVELPIDLGGASIVAETIDQREPIGGSMGYAKLTVERLRRLTCVLAVVFSVIGILVGLRRIERFRTLSGDYFPFVLAIAWLVHIVGYRIAIGAGLGFDDDPNLDQISTGFLLNDVDNLNYLSWAVQSQHGRNLFSVLFTTEPSAEIFFNPYFWIVGRLAAWLGVALPGVLNVLGLIGAAGTIVTVYAIARFIGFGPVAARWAAVFTAYSSGLTGLMTLLHLQFDLPLWMGCDALFIDSTTFGPFLSFPYQSFCYFLTSVIVLLLLQIDRARSAGASAPKGRLLSAFLLQMFLVASHPYEGMMILGSFGSYFLLTAARREDRTRLAARFWICVLLTAAAVPVAGYYAWVMRHPVYREFAVATFADWRPWWSWLIGYACILPTALVGCVSVYRNRGYRGALWIADWTTVVSFCLIIVNVAATTRFSAGLYIPLCIMAGHGWSLILDRIREISATPLRTVATCAAGAVTVLFFFTSFGLLLYGYQPYTYDGQLQHVARALREDSPGSFPSLLCDVRSARTLVVIGPVRAYAGHWSQTPDYKTKRDRMTLAGVNPADYPAAPQTPPTQAAFDDLVANAATDYVMVAGELPGARFASASPQLTDIGVFGKWRLFAIRR